MPKQKAHVKLGRACDILNAARRALGDDTDLFIDTEARSFLCHLAEVRSIGLNTYDAENWVVISPSYACGILDKTLIEALEKLIRASGRACDVLENPSSHLSTRNEVLTNLRIHRQAAIKLLHVELDEEHMTKEKRHTR